ncbi:MAG: alpha/beta hydrolase [Chloroflexota bacterium]
MDYRLSYVEMGTPNGRPTVILVHGLAASRYDWDALLPALASVGYRALAVDLLGHGDSDKPADRKAYTVESFYQAFEAWIDALNLQPPLRLVGHSLGGYLSLKYCMRHPGWVQTLALISPLYRLGQVSPLLRLFRHRPGVGARALRAVPLEWINLALSWDNINLAGFSPQARQRIALDYKRASPDILRVVGNIPDLMPYVEGVRVRTLVVWGGHDLTLNPRSFQPLVERLPDAVGQCLAHSGHQPHIGQPMKVNRMVLDFLDGHEVDRSL